MRTASLLLLALALALLVLSADARRARRIRGSSDPADDAVKLEKDEDRVLTIVNQDATGWGISSEANDNEFEFKAEMNSGDPAHGRRLGGR